VDGKVTHELKLMPSTSTTGKLRLKRVGSRLRYLVADGLDAPFVQMTEVEFGIADVLLIQVGGNTGDADAWLDFRMLSLTVQAEEDLPGLPERSAETPDSWGKGWLMAGALIAAVILTTAALGAWLHRRHGGKRRNEHPAQTVLGTSTPEVPMKPEAIPPA